jgi:WD40 repeat protein
VPTAGACLLLACRLMAQAAAFSADFAPQRESLTIPVSVAGRPADAVQCVVTYGPAVPVSAVAFSPDGKTLAAAGYHEVLIWDLAGGKLAKRLAADQFRGSIGALVFLNDGRLAVGEGTPQGRGAVRIFDIPTARQTQSFEEPSEVVYCLAVSPDGKLLAAGGADGLARVWSIEEQKLVATLKEHTDWILGVCFSGDGKLLATASADRNARVWDVATWEATAKFREDDAVRGAAFGSDGKSLALSVGGPNQRLLQMRRTDNVRSKKPVSTGAGMPLGVIWTGKASRMYAPCSDGAVRIYDGNGRFLTSIGAHEDWVYCAALSSDDAKLATGSADGTVKLFNPASGRPLATLVQLAPQTDDWLILTSQGYFAASSPNAVQWKTSGADAPPKELTDGLDSPERVRETLSKIDLSATLPKSDQPAKVRPKESPGTKKRKTN